MLATALLPWLALLPLTPYASPLTLVNRQSDSTTSGNNGTRTGISEVTKQRLKNITSTYLQPGMVVAVVSPGKDEVLTLGVQDSAGTSVTDETYFPIASKSKLFTAVGINLLISDGVKLPNGQPLALSNLVKDIIPGFQFKNASYTNGVTLRDLFTHRSGIPQHIQAMTPEDTPETHATRTRYFSINAPFGETGPFQYSNHNYEILSRVPEVLVNKSLTEILQKRVFEPLGVRITDDFGYLYSGDRQISQGFIRGAVNAEECAALVNSTGPEAALSETCIGKSEAFDFWKRDETNWGSHGGGHWIARGIDLVAWAKELVAPKVIPQSAIDRIQSSFPTNNTDAPNNASAPIESVAYQLGTVAQWYRGHKVYLHDGSLPGANSFFTRSPEKEVGVFVIGNDDVRSIPITSSVANIVMDDLLGLEPMNWEADIAEQLAALTGTGEAAESDTGSAPSTGGGSASNATNPYTPPPAGYANQTFSDPAYGNFKLIPFDATSSTEWSEAGMPVEFIAQAPLLGLNITAPAFVAQWHRSLVSTIVFTHYSGPHYNYTLLFTRNRIAANGSADGRVAKISGLGPAVFAEDGIGMFGNIALQPVSFPPPPVVTQNLKEVAPVFFARDTA